MIAKIRLTLRLTVAAPLGLMEPFAPAVADTVKVSTAKVAAMVWLAVTC